MDNEIKNLRTYEEDIKSAMDEGGVTTTKIVLAEQQKKNQAHPIQFSSEDNVGRNKKIKLILSGIILVALAAGIFFAITKYILPMRGSTVVPATIARVDFITVDKNIVIETVNKIYGQILDEVKKSLDFSRAYSDEDLVELNIIKTTVIDLNGVKNETRSRISTEDFFKLIDTRAPEYLIRSFGEKIMFGAYQKTDLEPFILIKVADRDQSFAGMIEWEQNLIRDVSDFFEHKLNLSEVEKPVQSPAPITITLPTFGTSSTSTIEIPVPQIETIKKPTYEPRNFVDVVMLNKDTRAIRNSNDEVIFFYCFIDKENLIMATSIDTLRKVISGLNTANLIR